MNDRLHYRDGRVTELDGTPVHASGADAFYTPTRNSHKAPARGVYST